VSFEGGCSAAIRRSSGGGFEPAALLDCSARSDSIPPPGQPASQKQPHRLSGARGMLLVLLSHSRILQVLRM
jgi:hypothetical protein